MDWKKFELGELNERVLEALKKNQSYSTDSILGLPGSFLDRKVFSEDANKSAYWKLLLSNPNHIGCHTFEESEDAFMGTQEIERELIKICAEEILKADFNDYDGYVSTGGTESNLQALWLFRNKYIIDNYVDDIDTVDANTLQQYFIEHINKIDVIYPDDTHYSIYKAAHILNLHQHMIPVDESTRQIQLNYLSEYIDNSKKEGKKYFIIVLNMGTTIFGSVNEIDPITELLENKEIDFTIHVDAAFGGFIYPFTNPNNKLTFKNTCINSFTLDAHKMLQSPYNTGIFIVRKFLDGKGERLIKYVTTGKASYIPGNDSTLCGSRSGANAVSIWMILKIYGVDGAIKFCNELIKRTSNLCKKLDSLKIQYFNDKYMNIVALRATDKIKPLAEKYLLVPDNHDNPIWYKIVVMDHVNDKLINAFIEDLKKYA